MVVARDEEYPVDADRDETAHAARALLGAGEVVAPEVADRRAERSFHGLALVEYYSELSAACVQLRNRSGSSVEPFPDHYPSGTTVDFIKSGTIFKVIMHDSLEQTVFCSHEHVFAQAEEF